MRVFFAVPGDGCPKRLLCVASSALGPADQEHHSTAAGHVVVTGHKCGPVGDLNREDFQILEQGRSREIGTFASGSQRERPISRSPGLEIGSISHQVAEQSSAVNIVLLDKADTAALSWVRSVKQISSFFSSHNASGRLAVYVLDLEYGLKVIEDYIENHQNLAKRLDRLLNQCRKRRLRTK